MRVAALYDIHANLPALEAVLAEPDVAGADLVVAGGDVLAGPMPIETLALLTVLGDRAAWVHGNTEREVARASGGKNPPRGPPDPHHDPDVVAGGTPPSLTWPKGSTYETV